MSGCGGPRDVVNAAPPSNDDPVNDEPAVDDDPVCTDSSCNGRGMCSEQQGQLACVCEAPFAGESCEMCSEGFSGDTCEPCAAAGSDCECVDGSHRDSEGVCVVDQCDGITTTRVLFIGNSYTSVNNLPSLFEGVASAENCRLEVDSALAGGARFSTHLQNATTLAKVASGGWDYVVLQNQSQVPGFLPADVLAGSVPNAEALVAAITDDSPNATPIYFATWGRRDGDAMNCAYYPLVCTFDGHTQALAEGYAQYLAATGGDVASVGLAWKAVVDGDPPFDAMDLWSGDGSHPSLRGSYLAALVLFTRIFQATANNNPFHAGLAAADAAFLQGVADD